MAAAVKQELPPGLRVCRNYEFKFTNAVWSVRDKLPDGFPEDIWRDTLFTALGQTINQMKAEEVEEPSLLYFQAVFLNHLWTHVCGLAGGKSPWASMSESVAISEVNGTDDKLVSTEEWVKLANSLNTGGGLVHALNTGCANGWYYGFRGRFITDYEAVERLDSGHVDDDEEEEEDEDEACST